MSCLKIQLSAQKRSCQEGCRQVQVDYVGAVQNYLPQLAQTLPLGYLAIFIKWGQKCRSLAHWLSTPKQLTKPLTFLQEQLRRVLQVKKTQAEDDAIPFTTFILSPLPLSSPKILSVTCLEESRIKLTFQSRDLFVQATSWGFFRSLQAIHTAHAITWLYLCICNYPTAISNTGTRLSSLRH